jgi:hypothetical protein
MFMAWACIKFYMPNSDDSENIANKAIALENVHSANIFCEKATWIKAA